MTAPYVGRILGAMLLDVAAASADLPSGYGASLLQALLALLAVSLLAIATLRWSARRGWGVRTAGAVRVVERVALDARRSLYVVRVGGRALLLGAGEGGSPSLITEIDPSELPPSGEPARSPFAALLARRAQIAPPDESIRGG